MLREMLTVMLTIVTTALQSEQQQRKHSTAHTQLYSNGYHHGWHPLKRPIINCTEVIAPTDSHPVRSPQSIHSAITKYINAVSLVEIGTRSGDGMACFAQVAAKSIAVEMDPPACRRLQERSQALGASGNRTFEIKCAAYQQLSLDADVFTWWFGGTGSQNPFLVVPCSIP